MSALHEHDSFSSQEGKRACEKRPVSLASEPWDMESSGIFAESVPSNAISLALQAGAAAGRIPRFHNDPHEALCNLGLSRGGFLTNAAALVFCRTRVPLVICSAYDSSECNVLLDAAECYGPLGCAYGQALAFMRASAPAAFVRRRIEARMNDDVFIAALAELLLNALAHRDWRLFAPTRVVVCPESIEVSNPGAFLQGEQVLCALRPRDGRRSPQDYAQHLLDGGMATRNGLLVQALYRFDAMNAQGTGLARVAAACDLCNCDIEWKNAGDATVASVFLRR